MLFGLSQRGVGGFDLKEDYQGKDWISLGEPLLSHVRYPEKQSGYTETRGSVETYNWSNRWWGRWLKKIKMIIKVFDYRIRKRGDPINLPKIGGGW